MADTLGTLANVQPAGEHEDAGGQERIEPVMTPQAAAPSAHPLAQVGEPTLAQEAAPAAPAQPEPAPAQPEPAPGGGAETFDEITVNKGGTVAAMGFVTDADTARALAGRLEARGISSVIRSGGIGGALQYLRSSNSPRLLFVDLSHSANPLGDIDGLAEFCEPGTTVVAIGAQNDVELFRGLIAAGVTDYLIKPIAFEAIDDALESAAERPAEMSDANLGKIVAFVGTHGGVGATSLAVNFAHLMSVEAKKKVAIVDLDLKFGAVSLALDIEPGRGLREALQNPSRIDGLFLAGAAVNVSDKLYVLGSEEPLEDSISFEPGALELLVQELRHSFDVVVLDMPRDVATRQQGVLIDATIVVVSDLSLLGVRDTLRLVGFAKRAATEGKVLTVLNREGADKKAQVPKADFEKGIEAKVDVVVPDDSKAMTAANHAGKPLAAVAKKAKATAAVRQLIKLVSAREEGEDDGKAAKAKAKAAAKEKPAKAPFWQRKKKEAE